MPDVEAARVLPGHDSFMEFLTEQCASVTGTVAKKVWEHRLADSKAARDLHCSVLSLLEWGAMHNFGDAARLEIAGRQMWDVLLAEGEQTWKALGQLESHWGVLKARALDHLQAWMQKNGVDATSQLKSALDIAVTDMLQAGLINAKQVYDARMQAVDGILTTFKNTISASGLVETQLKHFLCFRRWRFACLQCDRSRLCYVICCCPGLFAESVFSSVYLCGVFCRIESNRIKSHRICVTLISMLGHLHQQEGWQGRGLRLQAFVGCSECSKRELQCV